MKADDLRWWVSHVRAEAVRMDESASVKTSGLDYLAALRELRAAKQWHAEIIKAAADPTFEAPRLARYRNPWHEPRSAHGGPAVFETSARPRMVAGFKIYRRLPNCYDIVRDGLLYCQRAGPQGARDAAERLAKVEPKKSSK
jgi:hypothetical protein